MTEPHAVFVVDDEPSIRSMLQRLLRRSGYDVHCYATAAHARTALLRASFDAEPVDCVLLDMALEDDSNDTRAAEALLEELTHRLPTPGVLLMSGQLSHNEFFRLVMRGATDFVAKPWDPSELLSRVRKCSEIGRGRYLHHHGLSSELPEEPRDAFLSYASADQDAALGLRRVLDRMGISTWYAPADVKPGEQWPSKLDAALIDCHVFLVLLTPESLKSEYVRKEVTRALDRKATERDGFLLVPVMNGVALEALPDPLRALQAVDMSDTIRTITNVIVLADRISQFMSGRFSASGSERRRLDRRQRGERRTLPIS